jgi:hypothetical protein
MNERIQKLIEQATTIEYGVDNGFDRVFFDKVKFAELIISECSNILFDESERLFAYSTECDNVRKSDEAELIAEKCVDLITMIEQHFGVEE